MLDELKFAFAELGEKAGIIIIALIALWDFIIVGIRGFTEWHIGSLGIVGIIIGLVFVWIGSWARGYFEGRRR